MSIQVLICVWWRSRNYGRGEGRKPHWLPIYQMRPPDRQYWSAMWKGKTSGNLQAISLLCILKPASQRFFFFTNRWRGGCQNCWISVWVLVCVCVHVFTFLHTKVFTFVYKLIVWPSLLLQRSGLCSGSVALSRPLISSLLAKYQHSPKAQ